MKITHLSFDEHDNLFVEGINEKGKKEKTYIAIPPTSLGKPRVDIISMRSFIPGYTFGCENDVIVIEASVFGNKILSAPKEIIIK